MDRGEDWEIKVERGNIPASSHTTGRVACISGNKSHPASAKMLKNSEGRVLFCPLPTATTRSSYYLLDEYKKRGVYMVHSILCLSSSAPYAARDD